jgi:RTA1 like protein
MLLAAVCSAGELAGWSARIRSSLYPFDVNAYIAQIVVLILSPVFISAANYVTLERITSVVGQELSRINPKLYLVLFICKSESSKTLPEECLTRVAALISR